MTIEERVEVLERELSELKKALFDNKAEKDWRKTVGMSADEPGFDEMIRLGREYREQQHEEYR